MEQVAPESKNESTEVDGRRKPRTAAQIAALQRAQEARRKKADSQRVYLDQLEKQELEEREIDLKIIEIEQREREARLKKKQAILNAKLAKLAFVEAESSDEEEEDLPPVSRVSRASRPAPKPRVPVLASAPRFGEAKSSHRSVEPEYNDSEYEDTPTLPARTPTRAQRDDGKHIDNNSEFDSILRG
jgi:hypothetical protein